MLATHNLFKRGMISILAIFFIVSNLYASDMFLRIDKDDLERASLMVLNELEIIASQGDMNLVRCDAAVLDILSGESIRFETVSSYDHLSNEDLPPMPNGGIPMAVVTGRGNQGAAGWHEGAALAGHVLAYMETDVDGQLPGFTFWDMEKDSVWHHYIDTELEGDEPLFMAASDHMIYYTFHFMNPAISNSDMRYYWYDIRTDEHGEVENFGYGFEGFGVSDTWMMRVGSKGMGWNNQLLAHNIETGERFEMLADSTLGSWGYNFDNFGGPRTDGNTVIFTYIDYETYTPELMVRSLGEDGVYGTADDIGGTICSTASSYGGYRVKGRYIVWMERIAGDEGNIRAYDMGEDELYGTADDGGIMDICTDAAKQDVPRIDKDVIVWEDWRNVSNTAGNGEHDIYGYDLSTGTEFRSTARSDSLMMLDINGDEVLLVRPDWDEGNSYQDIYMMNITGRIQSDYYRIDVMDLGNPIARSLLTGDMEVSPYSFNTVTKATKGPLSAVFIVHVSGVYRALAYSAVTGEWSTEELYYSNEFTPTIQGENAMILGKGALNDGGTQYSVWLYNGRTDSFAPRETTPRPTGFAVGKNISFVWGDNSRTYFLRTYDAGRDDWYNRSGTTNDPWHVIRTDISDSLAVLLYGQGDTICDHIGMEAYDLSLHDWVVPGTNMLRIYQVNRHHADQGLYFTSNEHFSAVSQDRDDIYSDYVYTISVGDNEWKSHAMPYTPVLSKPMIGENFLIQGARSGGTWYGHIYNDCTGEWLSDVIESRDGIDHLKLYPDLMMAWVNQDTTFTHYAKIWAYSSASDGIQELYIQNPGSYFTVKSGEHMGFAYAASPVYSKTNLYAFNGLKGEWVAPKEMNGLTVFDMSVGAQTGIFLHKEYEMNGTTYWTAYGYSAFKDSWDEIDFGSNENIGIFTSEFCGLLTYDHYYYSSNKYFHAFNGIDGEWSDDVITMYDSRLHDIRLDDRFLMVVENGAFASGFAKVHTYSPLLNLWRTVQFNDSYELEGYMTTPTSAFAWDNNAFKIIFNTQTAWNSKTGQLKDLHVTDYAIAATLYNLGVTTTYYFYPPETEIIDQFEFTDGPLVNVLSSWAVEVNWKTNKYSDTHLVWGVDGYYEIIEKDTLEPVKDHRILIEGLEANKTYYYGAISVIAGLDTLHSDTLSFDTGADTDMPVLVGAPSPYRIHDTEASVWWETNEPSTPMIQWGLTETYTDSLEFNDATPSTLNAIRLYDLVKDTTYHYRVGGYDRYGNGPFFSGDYIFRTHNELPVVTDLQQADSTLWGCAFMTWEPPRIDSSFARESFSHGIPVDWKVYNRGESQKGNTWTSGYIGDNPVVYCSYGEQGEYQEEWLITSPITIDGTTGGVLNFWHMGFYSNYDNAINKVMISYTGTDPEDFTTIWEWNPLHKYLPTNWTLEQINLNWAANYGKTVYFAFVYQSTYGEIWAIDDIYMDFTIDGFYENFENDPDFWSQWQSKSPDGTSQFGLKDLSGNLCAGVEHVTSLPDPVFERDYWMISPSLQITNSHHLLGFWQMGWLGEYDNMPNEVRVVNNIYSYETSSEVIRSIYPVPNGWQWMTIDLSQYIGQSIRIAFRYQTMVGWYWNGLEWFDWWGEDWYIDDMYLFENAPEMVEDPNAQPGDKPMIFASSPDGKRIPVESFDVLNTIEPDKALVVSEAPVGRFDLPDVRPDKVTLPKVETLKAPSTLAEPKPELLGYEVYGRYPWETYYAYLGYVTTPSFIDWGTYLGYECEYYVEAVYDQGNSQPSEKVLIKGGTKYAENEYGYDSGVLYYSYWWYPGCSMANEFYFGDSVLNVEKIKVHIAKPGNFRVSLSIFDYDVYYTVFTSSTVTAREEGWYTIDLPIPTSSSYISSNEILVEFQPQDTLVQLSYEPASGEVSWIYNGSDWSATSDVFYIRLIGHKGPGSAVEAIPSEFKLAQNYPNPFNPTTTITFDLPQASELEVKIYDIRGALVKTLASGHREAGSYQMIWNATNMNGADVASGVYLVRMTAGDFTETRKMVLVR